MEAKVGFGEKKRVYSYTLSVEESELAASYKSSSIKIRKAFLFED